MAGKIKSISELKAQKTMEENKATYGDVIRKARTALGLSQIKVGELLGVSTVNVCNWEVGRTRPDMKLIPELCEALHISIAELFGKPNDRYELNDFDRDLVDTLHMLDRRNQQAVKLMAESLYQAQIHEFRNYCKNSFRRLNCSTLAASAGTGVDLDYNDTNEQITLRNCPSVDAADIIIPVSGDSMEPTFYDGDQLLVSYTSELEDGQIGILVINGEGFVKQVFHNGVQSHNSAKYPFREFKPGDEVRIIGRVLGRVEPDMLPTRKEQLVLDEIDNGIKD